jgi:archaellum component FlaC
VRFGSEIAVSVVLNEIIQLKGKPPDDQSDTLPLEINLSNSIAMSINVESDLKEILNKLDQKIDNLQSDVSGLRQQDIPTINVKLENLSTRMSQVEKTVDKVSTNQETIQKDVADLKGAKSLIIPIVVAVTTSILTKSN